MVRHIEISSLIEKVGQREENQPHVEEQRLIILEYQHGSGLSNFKEIAYLYINKSREDIYKGGRYQQSHIIMKIPDALPTEEKKQEEHDGKEMKPALSIRIKQDFNLTEAQRLYIQHQLPRCFTLVPVININARLNCNSKTLLEESLTFIERKRGRPEGSTKKSIKKSQNQRKSARIAITSKNKSNSRREKSINYSEQSNENSNDQSEKESYYNNGVGESVSQLKSASILNQIKKEHFLEASLEEQMSKTCKESEVDVEEQLAKDKKSSLQNKQGKLQLGKGQMQHMKTGVHQKGQSPLKVKQSDSFTPMKQKSNTQEKLLKKKSKSDPVFELPSTAKTDLKSQAQPTTIEVHQTQLPHQQNFESEKVILRRLKSHKQIFPFLQPVDEARDGAPNYYREISVPIDIQTIQFKLKTRIYKFQSEFHDDIRLMWANSKSYNRKNSFMQRVTEQLENFYLNLLSRVKSNRKKELSLKK